MRKSPFREPKMVLVFNNTRILIAIVRSLHAAGELTFCNTQAISFCCTGKYVMTGGFYFRHVSPDITIELDDLDNLRLEDYDKMCGEERKYYSVKELARLKKSAEARRQSKMKRGYL